MYEFKMPSLGAEMTQGKLLEWKVNVGDSIKKHDIIAVVDTDKAAIEIESFADGVVEKLISVVGDIIPVGGVMALITGEAEKTADAVKSDGSEKLESKTSAIKISPLARKQAKQFGIDISNIKGSGPGGVIIESDIQKILSAQSTLTEADHTQSMKKIIAAAMTKSKREIPHYYLSCDINMSNALNWLLKYNEQHPINERILYIVLLIKAVVRAITLFPEFNGFYVNNVFQPSDAIHIGMAISLRDGGLIAPAIMNMKEMSLRDIMQQLTDLVERTRSGKLRSSEISSPSITITNLGELGVDSVFGVIYPPQVALIGFGRISEIKENKENKIITATLSADHRVTNGLKGSHFLAAIDKFLQTPETL